MKTKSIGQRGFVEWLKKQHPNRRFKSHSYTTCPIGAYNRDWSRPLYHGGSWVDEFISAVDQHHLGGYAPRTLSPKQCLSILKGISK